MLKCRSWRDQGLLEAQTVGGPPGPSSPPPPSCINTFQASKTVSDRPCSAKLITRNEVGRGFTFARYFWWTYKNLAKLRVHWVNALETKWNGSLTSQPTMSVEAPPTSMDTTTHPHIFLLSLDKQPFFDDMYAHLIDAIASKATIQRASQRTSALTYLSTNKPTAIIITDPGITKSCILRRARESDLLCPRWRHRHFCRPLQWLYPTHRPQPPLPLTLEPSLGIRRLPPYNCSPKPARTTSV
jgi:hypothetical protein